MASVVTLEPKNRSSDAATGVLDTSGFVAQEALPARSALSVVAVGELPPTYAPAVRG